MLCYAIKGDRNGFMKGREGMIYTIDCFNEVYLQWNGIEEYISFACIPFA